MMIKNRTILCFASNYDAPPTSKHHVMRLLAKHNTVLWVNYHASRRPNMGKSDISAMARGLRQAVAGLRYIDTNLYVMTPMVVPLPSSEKAKQFNRRLLRAQLSEAISRIENGPLQVWSFAPDVAYLVRNMNVERIVYYCVDEFASFTGYDARQVARDERELCGISDLVITTSSQLYEAKRPWSFRTALIPHGVDYDHFASALTDVLPCPPQLEDLPHPVLGFFGLIRDWVDLDMIGRAAMMRPEWSFVMIGDSTVDLASYRDIPNLHFPGPQPYAELPAWCAHFDVGLIPFRINRLTEAVNPIKLREYLAAGLPVISTPLPEVRRYKQWVHLASTAEELIDGVEKICSPKQDGHHLRSQAMREETWQAKLELISQALEKAHEPYPAEIV